MEDGFYNTFSAVVKLANNGGLYLPGNEVIYPRFGCLIKYLVHFQLIFAVTIFVVIEVGEFIVFSGDEKFRGLTKEYMLLASGTLWLTYFRLIYVQIKAGALKQLLDAWEKDLSHGPDNPYRNVKIRKMKQQLTKLAKFYVGLLIIPLPLWLTRPFITGVEVIPLGFPNRHQSPGFELIAITIIFFAYHIASVWSAYEIIQVTLMKSVEVEIEHLQHAFGEIFQTMRTSDDSATCEFGVKTKREQENWIRQQIRIWVKHHQVLIRYSRGINDLMGPLILMNFLGAIVFAFTTAYVNIWGDLRLDNQIEAVFYLIFYFYMMFATCSLGDNIQLKSMEITRGVLGKKWYIYPKDVLRNLQIMQIVTYNRPIQIKATGFKNLTRANFKWVCKTGYEMITLISNTINR